MKGSQTRPNLQGRVARLILQHLLPHISVVSELLERSKREDGETLVSIVERNEMVASDIGL
jgi:hypothetical protein